MDKTEKRICLYSAILIALMINCGKLLALRENGIIAHYWHFNLAEFIFQLLYNFIFIYLLLYLNIKYDLWAPFNKKRYLLHGLLNVALLIFCVLIGGFIQRELSSKTQLPGMFWSGYLARFILSSLFAGIVIKIILLIRESSKKSQENEQLKNAYLEAELELLKGQLNPHFLFNSLSSLSGIIRENPGLAQHYVNQLSKVFRYALQKSGASLVTVADELEMIKSYGQLLTMRFENAFQMDIKVDAPYLEAKIPHLSLQLLLENAAKHNSATLNKPLKVTVFVSDGYLIFSNNLQEIPMPESSTGIGLANLDERFKILLNRNIEIVKAAGSFLVKLPLTI
jgi:two-component system LytT family sensor kinase